MGGTTGIVPTREIRMKIMTTWGEVTDCRTFETKCMIDGLSLNDA
jgi:hypothetical protein